MTDVADLPPLSSDDAKPSEIAQIKVVLTWFIDRVKNNKPIDAAVLRFIADGVEAHVNGKKPWPASRGKKKRTEIEALYHAFPIYEKYLSCRKSSGQHAGRTDHSAQARTDTAESLKISEYTVKRAIETVNEAQKTANGRAALMILRLPTMLREFEAM